LAIYFNVQFQEFSPHPGMPQPSQKSFQTDLDPPHEITRVQDSKSFPNRIIVKLPARTPQIADPTDGVHITDRNNQN
jgi:hypothetical protein